MRIISIHALLTESDRRRNPGRRRAEQFQSTLSSRRATARLSDTATLDTPISIHALLTESDLLTSRLCCMATPYFNPRSPHGERLLAVFHQVLIAQKFQSTLSSRRATDLSQVAAVLQEISIHALLTESDCSVPGVDGSHGISIHALLTESDRTLRVQPPPGGISIHALLTESDYSGSGSGSGSGDFNPRSPHGERLQLHFLGVQN